MDVLTSKLWTALLLGEYHLAKQLIIRGANVNVSKKTQFGVMTLLHYTTVANDIYGMRLLIKHGANCNARASPGRTPLHCAVSYPYIGPGNTSMGDGRGDGDRLDVVELLINEGAVVDARNDTGSTPLHLAVENKFNKAAEKLIARGASIEAVDRWGDTILHTAVRYDNLSMVKVLISHAVNINAKAIYSTPLVLAIQTHYPCNMDIIQLLLENGADVNIKCQEGTTALHQFCKNYANRPFSIDKAAETVALLLKFGADFNAFNHKGKTPFELLHGTSNNPAIAPVARVIIREAVKREALDQPLCEKYKQMVQSHESYSEFEKECREEVMRMRSEKIDIENRVVSFFYIFSIHEEKLVTLARNKKIVTAFETSDYLASFRIYADELTTKFEVAKKRASFLMSVEDCLVDVLGHILPAPIVRKMATYVKVGDIIKNEL